MAPQKRLSWEEWQRRANADYVKGEFGVQQMIASWGYPEGMSAETHKLEFDKGKAKPKDRAGRRAQRAKDTVKRQEATATQTVGKDVYGKNVVTPKGSELHEHHKRIVNVYAPFFEGLNPKETKELAQWFDDEGFPLGNVKKNLEAATEIEHEAIHTWARDNFIEPKTGKPLLNFKNYTLNERLVPALTFLEQVQPAVDEKLSEIKSTAVKPKSNLMPKVARNPLMRGAKAISRAIPGPVDAVIPGVIGGGLALAGGATLPQAAEAFGGGVAEGLSGDLEGAPEPTVTMVNVGGKMRPLNTGTNTLMDKPGYGLEQSNGQWREVQRGMGAASKQQSKVQADQLIPVPKPVMANTPTGVAQLKAMPKSKNIDLVNEAKYFILNPIGSAFSRVFGNRDI